MKRITSIVLVLAILFISITSFAASDGGLILKKWYEKSLEQTEDELASEFVSEMIGQNHKISQASSDRMDEAEVKLEIFSTLMSDNSATEVSNYQNHYILRAQETEKALKKRNFSDFKSQESAKIASELDKDAVKILADILQ